MQVMMQIVKFRATVPLPSFLLTTNLNNHILRIHNFFSKERNQPPSQPTGMSEVAGTRPAHRILTYECLSQARSHYNNNHQGIKAHHVTREDLNLSGEDNNRSSQLPEIFPIDL